MVRRFLVMQMSFVKTRIKKSVTGVNTLGWEQVLFPLCHLRKHGNTFFPSFIVHSTEAIVCPVRIDYIWMDHTVGETRGVLHV